MVAKNHRKSIWEVCFAWESEAVARRNRAQASSSGQRGRTDYDGVEDKRAADG
jgi:hypothetical protein